MSAQSLVILFFASAYIAPPIFLFHILWLLVPVLLSGKPLWSIFQDVVVIQDDIFIPHLPGFYVPFEDELKIDENTLNSISCSSDSTLSTTCDINSAETTGIPDGRDDQVLDTETLDFGASDKDHLSDIFVPPNQNMIVKPKNELCDGDEASSSRSTCTKSSPSLATPSPTAFPRSMTLTTTRSKMPAPEGPEIERAMGTKKLSKMGRMISTKLARIKKVKMF